MTNTPISIEQLRYVRIGTSDLAAASDFAQRILGLQLVEKTGTQATFRSDYRDHTLVYALGDPQECAVAFELRDPATLNLAATLLTQRGFDVCRGSAPDAAARKVKDFISFKDASGYLIELVIRPLHSGWRYFPSRDAGILGLAGVALADTSRGASEALWTELFSGRVSDWVGDAAYIRFDQAHHRLALHPSDHRDLLVVEFGVESIDQIMQANYFLQSAQVRIVHGPGRRPTSNQLFITFAGPEGVLFSYVAEGETILDETRRSRQFPRERLSFCAWGSESEIPQFRESPAAASF